MNNNKSAKNVRFAPHNVHFSPENALRMPKNAPVKPYNMAVLSDDSAEINMYGDVVAIVPTDWYTGERLAGYIGVDEFLEDLEEIKDKSNITVHINSGGGDLYAGLAIYNRLKTLKGTVTTVNDGLAASAASLIFQAGDIRQMNSGSNLMAHGVAGFLFGYYNLNDLKNLMTQFKAHNKAVVNVYAEAMGVSYDEAKSFVEGETWLTGEEAVNKGLADEVIDLDKDDEGAENNLLNRLLNRMQSIYTPAAEKTLKTANTAAVPPIANIDNSIETGGTENMDIKNVEDLRNAYPDLVAQIENAAKKESASAEQARIKSIEGIENSIADKNLVNDAKYGENPMTAEQLALKAMQAQSAIGATMLANMADDAKASGANAVPAAPTNAADEGEEDEKKEQEKEQEEAKNLAALVNGMRK